VTVAPQPLGGVPDERVHRVNAHHRRSFGLGLRNEAVQPSDRHVAGVEDVLWFEHGFWARDGVPGGDGIHGPKSRDVDEHAGQASDGSGSPRCLRYLGLRTLNLGGVRVVLGEHRWGDAPRQVLVKDVHAHEPVEGLSELPRSRGEIAEVIRVAGGFHLCILAAVRQFGG